jgi:hypothetical protein
VNVIPPVHKFHPLWVICGLKPIFRTSYINVSGRISGEKTTCEEQK